MMKMREAVKGEEYRSRFYDEHFIRAMQVNETNLQLVPLFIGNNCKLSNVVIHPFDTNCYTFENDIGKFSVLDGDYIYKDHLNRLHINRNVYFGYMFEKVKSADSSDEEKDGPYTFQYVRKKVGEGQDKVVDVIKYEVKNRNKINEFLSPYGYKLYYDYGIGGIVAIRKPGQSRGKYVYEGQYIVVDKNTGSLSIYTEKNFKQMFEHVGIKVTPLKLKEIKINIGDTVQIDQYEYIVAHKNTDNTVYLILKYSNGMNLEFDICGDTSYERSTIRELCKQWWKDEIPENIKPLLITLDCGYGCPVFIPTLAQVASTTKDSKDSVGYYHGSGEWSYFADDDSRVFNPERMWWLQSQLPDDSSYVCFVDTDGSVGSRGPNHKFGFRPAICMCEGALQLLLR